MNEQELFVKIAEIKTRHCDDIQKCDEVFQLIALSLRNWGSVPVTPAFKRRLRRCIDDVYCRAQDQSRKGPDETSFAS
jgi:hypothetical protein